MSLNVDSSCFEHEPVGGTAAELPDRARWTDLGAAARAAKCSRRQALNWCLLGLVVCARLPSANGRGPWRVAVWEKGGLPVRLPARAGDRFPGARRAA